MKFLHTADWQLGMTRHFLDEDAQPRYTAARIDVIERLGQCAVANGCEFIVVCGDVFESNHLSPRVIKRSLEAMEQVGLPIYLLPGNHDPLDAGSVYRNPAFKNFRPDNVVVLDGTSVVSFPSASPTAPPSSVELLPAPWFSKHPNRDLVLETIQRWATEPADSGVARIVVGHGIVDELSPDQDDPALINLRKVEDAVARDLVHFIALGDRHSFTRVGVSGRIYYAGAPEVTDFDDVEIDSGTVATVDLSEPTAPEVERQEVGSWRFRTILEHTNNDDDVTRILNLLHEMPNKDRTVVRIAFTGTLTLAQNARLEAGLESMKQVFAALDIWERRMDLAVTVDDVQLEDLGVSGFLASAAQELNAQVAESDEIAAVAAKDALGLLYRLAGGER